MHALFAQNPVVLAPMEDVSDRVFRRVCRSVGASLCVTEFVAAEQMLADSITARRRAHLDPDDRPTAIQIYGADPALLRGAAQVAARANPAFIDLNCGCWIPSIARRGAGAGWLRDPTAMVEMAREIVASSELPVTVKTRIGWGPESEMPIVDLARRLEDVGVAALTIHCRVAQVGHTGPADWSWARRAREVVSIPVIVNGDVNTAADAVRALAETGCAGVMIGRAAIAHPWIFRETTALLAGTSIPPPTDAERRALYAALATGNVETRARGRARRDPPVPGDPRPTAARAPWTAVRGEHARRHARERLGVTRQLHLVRHGRPVIDPDRPAAEWGLDPRGTDGIEALRASGVLPAGACWVSSPEAKARETAQLLTKEQVNEDPALVEARRGTGWIGDKAAFERVVRVGFADPATPAAPRWAARRHRRARDRRDRSVARADRPVARARRPRHPPGRSRSHT
ncbi:MAG: tRNA-dihydrouridine synthase [Kofleriaceae bacterium]